MKKCVATFETESLRFLCVALLSGLATHFLFSGVCYENRKNLLCVRTQKNNRKRRNKKKIIRNFRHADYKGSCHYLPFGKQK